MSTSSTTVGTPVSFDAHSSSDPDGTITSYAWQFGDGGTGSGVTAQHAYAAPGTYSVRLTVSDNRGASDSEVRAITVSPGAADLSIQIGTAKPSYLVGESIVINYSVNRTAYVYICDVDSTGKMSLIFPSYREQNNHVSAGAHTLPAGGYTLRVSEPTGTETVYVFAATSPLPNFPTYFGSSFPVLSYDAGSFRNSVLQTMQTQLPPGEWAENSLTFTVLSSAPTSGTLQVSSSPQGASVTIDGSPAGTTPMQVAAAAGQHTVTLARSGYQTETRQITVMAGQTAYLQVPLVPQAQNQPPTAAFSVSPPQGTVGQPLLFDASGAADPDGWIVSYTWDFGDGTGGGGVQATHAYASPGTYTARLTVGDNQGLSASSSAIVSVSAPGAPPTSEVEGSPAMGGTPGIFVWGTNTWHVTVNAGAGWTTAHGYRIELRTDGGSFQGANQSTSGGVVALGVVPTPTDGGKTLVFDGSLQSGSVDYTFTVPNSTSVWMSLKLDIDGNGSLDESDSFVYLRQFMVHPPAVPLVVGFIYGNSGPLVPSTNFRVGRAFAYSISDHRIVWITDIATLEGH